MEEHRNTRACWGQQGAPGIGSEAEGLVGRMRHWVRRGGTYCWPPQTPSLAPHICGLRPPSAPAQAALPHLPTSHSQAVHPPHVAAPLLPCLPLQLPEVGVRPGLFDNHKVPQVMCMERRVLLHQSSFPRIQQSFELCSRAGVKHALTAICAASIVATQACNSPNCSRLVDRWLGYLTIWMTLVHGLLFYILWGAEGTWEKNVSAWSVSVAGWFSCRWAEGEEKGAGRGGLRRASAAAAGGAPLSKQSGINHAPQRSTVMHQVRPLCDAPGQ